MKKTALIFIAIFIYAVNLLAQNNHAKKFEQLGPELATPNVYRTASGAPGHMYWQQKADYDINIEINDAMQSATGSEKITYSNNSPDAISYLEWQVQGQAAQTF